MYLNYWPRLTYVCNTLIDLQFCVLISAMQYVNEIHFKLLNHTTQNGRGVEMMNFISGDFDSFCSTIDQILRYTITND